MKRILFISLCLLFVPMFQSCEFLGMKEVVPEEHEILVIFDLSSPTHKNSGYVTAKTLLSMFGGLSAEDKSTHHNYGSIRMAGVNDLLSARPLKASLKKPKPGSQQNSWDTKELVEKFEHKVEKNLQKVLDMELGSDKTKLYVPLCKYLKRSSKDANRTIIIISDLMESSAVNFYKRRNDLVTERGQAAILEELEKEQALPELDGATVYLLYSSENETNKASDAQFQDAVKFWTYLFDEAGAEEIIDAPVLDY